MSHGAHTIVRHIGRLWTMSDRPGVGSASDAYPRCGRDAMQDVGELTGAALAIDAQGNVLAVGADSEVAAWADEHTVAVDAKGGFVCPGFVDPHTHLVHGGSRELEVPLRLAGASYLDILQAGGGILSTMRETRARRHDELLQQARVSANRLLSCGVTWFESKTGYGLDLLSECKQLAVARELERTGVWRIVHTAMPAHAIPPERQGLREQWIDEIALMLPVLHQQGAEFADVFVEQGVFSTDEARYILTRAQAIGMRIRLHADEIVSCQGAELAAELGAVSADHLLAASDTGLWAMARAGVLAVCLPGTSFYLQKPPARARFMIDEANLAVAIASDYNPGSSPCENFGLTMSLALLTLRMSPEEVWVSATRNAACVLARGEQAGVIAPGRPADFVIYPPVHPAYILTHYGINHVQAVYARGRKVV